MKHEPKHYIWIVGGFAFGIGGFVWLQLRKRKEQAAKANDEFTDWFIPHSDFKESDKAKLTLVLANLTNEEKEYIKKSITSGDITSSNIRLIGLMGKIKMDFKK